MTPTTPMQEWLMMVADKVRGGKRFAVMAVQIDPPSQRETSWQTTMTDERRQALSYSIERVAKSS